MPIQHVFKEKHLKIPIITTWFQWYNQTFGFPENLGPSDKMVSKLGGFSKRFETIDFFQINEEFQNRFYEDKCFWH